MATIVKEIRVNASPDTVWDAIREIGALHTRLVPGFVVATSVEEGGAVRLVTFVNGMTLREPIVSLDETRRRLVWSAHGGRTTHYNAAAQVLPDGAGALVVWTADFLPNEAGKEIDIAMTAGAAAMKRALDVEGSRLDAT